MAHVKIYGADHSSFVLSKYDIIDLIIDSRANALNISNFKLYMNKFTLSKDSFFSLLIRKN